MKIICIISFLIAILFNTQTRAQSYVVGNPDSENTLFLQSTTEYIPPQPSTDWEPLPDSPDVEVAPPPNRVPEIELQKPIIENNETIIEQQPQPLSAQQFD